MNLGRKKSIPTPEPDGLYVCIGGFWSKKTGHSIAGGTTLRGSHPDVLAAPTYWVKAGLSDDEIHAIKVERGLIAAVA